jgi:hypothetical protein
MKTKFNIQHLLLLIFSIFIISCNNETSSSNLDYCKDNPCKDSLIPHKTLCEVTKDNFICVCENGYELDGDTCKEIVIDLCENKNCDENSSCKVLNDLAQCVCNAGYYMGENTCEKIQENSFHKTWSDNSYTENSGVSLTIDNDNNILVVGYQSSKMVWNEEEQKDLPTESDTTLRKYSQDGDLIWEKAWHDDVYDFPVGIVTDSNNNIFIAGETGSDVLRVFLIKLDSDGNKKTTKEWSCNDGLLVWDLAIDNDDNLYITGRTYSNFSNTTSKGGISDSFLIKASNSGQEEWIKQWGTSKMDEGKAIIVKDDNIFVLTENNGDTDIPDTEGSIKWDFNIAKFDKNGNLISDTNWMKGLTDTYVVDFAIDDDYNYYIIGDSPKDFDGYANNGENDIFIIKLDNTLTRKWSKLIGTAYYDTANTIALDSNNNIYLGGHSYGSFEGFTNPGEGIESDSLLIKFNDENIDWFKMFSSSNRLAGESISKLIIQNDNLIFTGVEDADYIGDTQNLKSSGYLRKLINEDF